MATEVLTGPVNGVPDEILLKIFTKLSLSDLLLSARPVCKRWLRLSRDESLWIKVDFSTLFQGCEHTNRTKNANGVEALLSDIQDCVEKITFNNVPLESESYELFCRSPKNYPEISFQKLSSLDYSYSSVNLCHLRRALSTYSSITELILIYTKILLADVVTEVLHLPHLKKLVFHDIHAWENFLDHPQDFSRNTNSRSLTQVPKHCPHLEWVELYTMWARFDDDVIQQFILWCSHLKRLHFTWSSHLTEIAFKNPKKDNSVTHLGLADRQGQGAYLDFVLPHFPNLVSLTVAGFQVYHEDCVTLGACCPNLQELILDVKDLREPLNVFFFGIHQRDTFLCTAKLQEIAQHCKFLRKLHAPCSKVDDEGFSYLLKHCPLLEDINFMCCPNLTVKCLHMLSKYSRNMKYVNFQYTFSTHEYLHVLLSNCLQLYEVILDTKMSDGTNSLQPHSLMSPSSPLSPANACDSSQSFPACNTTAHNNEELPFIDVLSSEEEEEEEEVSQTSDADINNSHSCSVSQNCILQKDDMRNVAYHEAIYFAVLPTHCHIVTLSLKDANLSSCDLQQIFQLCPDLTHIDLDGCIGLKDETIQSLIRHCQNLKVLMMSSRENIPCHIGDDSLRALCKYSRNLEVISILNNRCISHKGICCILDSLDNSLRQLHSLSFCVGANFKCKMPLPDVHWLKYLSKRSAISLEEATGSRGSSHYRILHLEFLRRRY